MGLLETNVFLFICMPYGHNDTFVKDFTTNDYTQFS